MNTDTLFHAIDSIKEEFDEYTYEVTDDVTVSDEWIEKYIQHLCKKYKVNEDDAHPHAMLWTTPMCILNDTPQIIVSLIEKLKELCECLKTYDEKIPVDKMAIITELSTIALANQCSYLIRRALLIKELAFADFRYNELRELRNTLINFKNEDIYSKQYTTPNIKQIYHTKTLRELYPLEDFTFLRTAQDTQQVRNITEDILENFCAYVRVRQESFVIMMALLEHLLPLSSAIYEPMENVQAAKRVFMIESYRQNKFNTVNIEIEVQYLLTTNTIKPSYTLDDWQQLYQQQLKLFKEDTLGKKLWDYESKKSVNWFYRELLLGDYSRTQLNEFFHLKMLLEVIKKKIIEMQAAHQSETVAEEPQPILQQADEEQALYDTNIIFNCRIGMCQVDLLKLKQYIQEKFILFVEKRYHWMALLVFLQQNKLLSKTSNEAFAKQMNMEGWFKDCKCRCSADSLRDYKEIRNNQYPSTWLDTVIPEGSKMSDKGISDIKRFYDRLTIDYKIASIAKVE